MNISLRAALWITGVLLALLLLVYVLSGFESKILAYGGIILGTAILPPLLFISNSFIYGLKDKERPYWAIGAMLVCVAADYIIPSPLLDSLPDPKVIYAILYFILIFALAFGCGYLWRLGLHHPSSYLLQTIKYIGTVCIVIVLGYIGCANLGDFGLGSSHWIEPHYNNGRTEFYDRQLRLSPFPGRVIGVRYYNKYRRFAGASAEQPCNHLLNDMRLGETPDGSADILLHKQYKPMVTQQLADCKDAYRKESGRTTIYLFYKNDTLQRVETDQYENGIISTIRRYDEMSFQGYYESAIFDELGAPQIFKLTNGNYRWRMNDFRVEPEVPHFSYGYDNLNNPKLDKRLRKALDWNSICKQARSSLKAMGESEDNLSVALLLEGFAIGKDTTISVAIDADSYYGNYYMADFELMKTPEQMQTVGDALSLCHLESAITERIVCGSNNDDYIQCPRIRIKENSGRDKYVILYLLKDRAISADFKFRFVYDPSIHADKKKQEEAATLWKKMHQLADEYKETTD